MPKLLIVHGTTRPSRTGILVSRAFESLAKNATDFDVDLADLKEINLPFLDEVDHPRAGNYQLPHTLEWAKRVAAADAIVWATPQYNGSFSAPLKNAIDFLCAEWVKKPLGLLSWGGASGGLDAAHALRPIAAILQMPVIEPLVGYVNYWSDINEDGTLTPSTEWTEAATRLLRGLEESVSHSAA